MASKNRETPTTFSAKIQLPKHPCEKLTEQIPTRTVNIPSQRQTQTHSFKTAKSQREYTAEKYNLFIFKLSDTTEQNIDNNNNKNNIQHPRSKVVSQISPVSIRFFLPRLSWSPPHPPDSPVWALLTSGVILGNRRSVTIKPCGKLKTKHLSVGRELKAHQI